MSILHKRGAMSLIYFEFFHNSCVWRDVIYSEMHPQEHVLDPYQFLNSKADASHKIPLCPYFKHAGFENEF